MDKEATLSKIMDRAALQVAESADGARNTITAAQSVRKEDLYIPEKITLQSASNATSAWRPGHREQALVDHRKVIEKGEEEMEKEEEKVVEVGTEATGKEEALPLGRKRRGTTVDG